MLAVTTSRQADFNNSYKLSDSAVVTRFSLVLCVQAAWFKGRETCLGEENGQGRKETETEGRVRHNSETRWTESRVKRRAMSEREGKRFGIRQTICQYSQSCSGRFGLSRQVFRKPAFLNRQTMKTWLLLSTNTHHQSSSIHASYWKWFHGSTSVCSS